MTFTTINTPELRLKHLASMSNSLAHRLEVARANHDDRLTVLLEREYQQLMADCKSVSLGASKLPLVKAVNAWFQRRWDALADTIPNWYQLQIQETVAENGRPCWLVYYPKTGQTLRTESETEMQAWIKQVYWNA